MFLVRCWWSCSLWRWLRRTVVVLSKPALVLVLPPARRPLPARFPFPRFPEPTRASGRRPQPRQPPPISNIERSIESTLIYIMKCSAVAPPAMRHLPPRFPSENLANMRDREREEIGRGGNPVSIDNNSTLRDPYVQHELRLPCPISAPPSFRSWRPVPQRRLRRAAVPQASLAGGPVSISLDPPPVPAPNVPETPAASYPIPPY